MKKINVLYLAVIPILYVIVKISFSMHDPSLLFYGFAENKETELSHDVPIYIEKIHVEPGQRVQKDDLLLEAHRYDIDIKIQEANVGIEQLNHQFTDEKGRLIARLAELESKKLSELQIIDNKIQLLESKLKREEALLLTMESYQNSDEKIENKALQDQLKLLKESRQVAIGPLDAEISSVKERMKYLKRPLDSEKQKLEDRIQYHNEEQLRLQIKAPHNGIVGNVLCKEGEHVRAFNPVLNFYEPTPTYVRGFVHESSILEVSEGDSLRVSSSLHPTLKVNGTVIGLGSRIVEIPERLRKDPLVKTYGREVLIRVPEINPFLQKEKVILNLQSKNEVSTYGNWFGLLTLGQKSIEKRSRYNSLH